MASEEEQWHTSRWARRRSSTTRMGAGRGKEVGSQGGHGGVGGVGGGATEGVGRVKDAGAAWQRAGEEVAAKEEWKFFLLRSDSPD